MTDATCDHEDRLISDDAYNTMQAEWNGRRILRKWSTARHEFAHTGIRSASEQKTFILALNLQNFVDSDMNILRIQLLV